MSDIVERLRKAHKWAISENDHIEPELVSEAADEIDRLRLALFTVHAEGMEEARNTVDKAAAWDACNASFQKGRSAGMEEAARYHDDCAAEHEACGWESQHHEMMTREHRRFAAAIRRAKESKT